MCGAREGPGWWKPLPLSRRRWETLVGEPSSTASIDQASCGGGDLTAEDAKGEGIRGSGKVDEKQDEALFRHGASPVRTHAELPPKISWTHVWGTMKWGKRPEAWGKRVEGLEMRNKEKEKSKDKGYKNK